MPATEGDLPRAVDMDAPALETHNRVPVDEAHPTLGVNPTPRTPSQGGSDQEQLASTILPDTPHAPIGPDTQSGSRLTNVPTPPIALSDHSPTAAGAGMYGAPAEGDAHSPDTGDDEQ